MTVAWAFGDGFDTYREIGDAILGYWDSGTTANVVLGQLNSGRFVGSRCLNVVGASPSVAALVKSSGSNDATHHLSLAIKMTTSGTANGFWFTLSDGTTAQCSIVFKNNGDILLTAGASSGSTLATYASAVSSNATWFYFEIEVVINNSTGSFKVRKNGNGSDDHSTTSLNTRASANNYANKLSVGDTQATAVQQLDDLLWRSDSTVAWVGDIRCFTRMPAADSSVQFTPSSASLAITPFVQGTTANIVATTPKYVPFVATASGTIASVILSLAAGYTGNMKCTLFADTGLAASGPTSILSSATAVTNPVTGNNTFTFGSPPSITQGTLYWLGFSSDSAVTGGWNTTATINATLPPGGAYANNGAGASGSISYASFPTASPGIATSVALIFTVNVTPTTANNAMLVGEVVEDQAGTYVSSSTVNNVDFYTPQSISATPSSVVCVTTRALCQKTDAGTRNIAVQIKSGSTTSTGTSTALNTTWGWIFMTNQVDPDTGSAWTATGVNNATFGPKLTA